MSEFSIWNDKWKKILKYSLIWIPKYFVKINFWLKNIQKPNCNKLNLILRLGCHLFGYSKESFFLLFSFNLVIDLYFWWKTLKYWHYLLEIVKKQATLMISFFQFLNFISFCTFKSEKPKIYASYIICEMKYYKKL